VEVSALLDGRPAGRDADANHDPVHIATELRALQDCGIPVEDLSGKEFGGQIWRAAPH
jgi:hypothetical protein